MKIKFKHEPDGHVKCPNCNWESVYFLRLDGWDKDDWLCGNCFSEDLLNGKYFIETKDYKKGFDMLDKILKRLGL